VTRLIIGNDFSEALRTDRGWCAWWVQRAAWFAGNGDVLVLPVPPDEAFLGYVTSLTGVRRESLRIVVPPPGRHGTGLLTVDRLTDIKFREELHGVLAGTEIESVFPLWPDACVAALARAMGCEQAVPGLGFLSQGGGVLANSKAAFRAVAAGAGVPIPSGTVCSSQQAAEEQIVEMFELGQLVMLKQDFLSGGRGNEILSPAEDFRPVGARRTVVLRDRAAVCDYLERTWDWLSADRCHRVVVEEYLRDSAAYYGEYLITDDAVEVTAHGELFYAPYAVAQLIPASASGLDAETLATLLEHGRRLSESLRTMGYRGYLSADAIVTPARDIFFTEWNGRVTGSTHLYHALGKRVVGDYTHDRVLLDRSWPPGWTVASFPAAVDALAGAGLAYDPASRTGVMLSSAFNEDYRSVMHCVVAENAEAAWDIDRRLGALFGAADRS
jgi:hypothetical protein